MPEATEQGNHPNPKPAAQAQGGQGSSGNRSGNRGARGGGHRATNRSHNQDHQRHGGNRKPPPGIGGEEHGKGTYHSRSHDGGGSQRHSDGNQTTGRRSEQKGNARHSDGSSSRSSQQSHMRSQSAARHLESDQTSHRGKPPGSAQMGAKFQPSIEQKSPGQRPVDDEKGNSLLPHTNDPSEPRESGPVEPTLTDPCIVEQKELTVEEQQQQAQHIHMQMQQQQFLQLALAQQLYFQQIQQQAVRVAAMMAAQQQLQQEQTETKQGEGERPDYAAVDKHQPIENSTEKQSEGHGEGASSKSQVGTFKPVPFDIVLPMPESGQQMVSDDVSEQELARHLDMFMKEQGLVTGNDVSSRIPDHSVFRQQFVDQANSHVAREADLVHPQYTQELSAFSRTSEGYKIDTPLVSSAAGTSAFSSSGTSRDPLFFTHPAHSSETAASTSHLITTQPPVEDDLLTVSHSYSCTPPLQPTNTAVYNGHSTSSPFDFVHDSPGCTFTGLSDHSSEHSWLGDSEPQLTSLTSESAAFETVGVTVRPVGRVTDSTSQPDTRRQRKGASHKPSPRQVTLEVGGRMFYVYPATFQSYPDSLLNQVLNGSKPVKLNEGIIYI
ncbi:uncharacterized protein LOC134196587 isoform X2 [Corticium candelabrum]|uniref:uncharacterized protein LOC134196587 isoform X2 n=1 Tax=Corticium candelabrum TaxID=121492 RepID=UPI002E25B93D|nr:uncharacterized protein LOC134196587 isoform X2 [Corticium candelabrum]